MRYSLFGGITQRRLILTRVSGKSFGLPETSANNNLRRVTSLKSEDLTPVTLCSWNYGAVNPQIRLATGWTVRGLNPGGGVRFSAPVQTGPGAHPTSCTMVTGSFLGGKERPGRDADPSPPSSAVVNERVEL